MLYWSNGIREMLSLIEPDMSSYPSFQVGQLLKEGTATSYIAFENCLFRNVQTEKKKGERICKLKLCSEYMRPQKAVKDASIKSLHPHQTNVKIFMKRELRKAI